MARNGNRPKRILRIRSFLLRNIVFVTAAALGVGYLIAMKSATGLALWVLFASLSVVVVFLWNGELW